MMLHEISPAAFHIEYRNVLPEDGDTFLFYRGGREILADVTDDVLKLPTVAEGRKLFDLPEDAAFIYFFSVDETRYFICPEAEERFGETAHAAPQKTGTGVKNSGTEETIRPEGPYQFHPVRALRKAGPREAAYPAAMGLQLHLWYRRSRFCGVCGARTVRAENERMVRCPACGNLIYPLICPSVIIGVLDEKRERMLVTCYSPNHLMMNAGTVSRATTGFALVAGYVESGETPEETVRREVMEEVGLKVRNIRYYKSQPWPFSSSLLLGYYCEAFGDSEVRLDDTELSSAVWMRREEMPVRADDISLTSEMMEKFRLGEI